MIIVVKPLPAGQPKSDSIPTNNSKSDKPVIISGITKGAVIIPVNKGLALNFLNLTKAIEARVPKQMAMEALLGWPAGRGLTTIIIAHTTFSMAFVAVVVQSRLVDMDSSIEEAALDLGATPIRVFFDITLPTIMPALIAGWLLSFTLSLDDLVIASFVSGPASSTLPMVVFSKVRLGISPEVNALATIIIGVVALGVILASWQIRKSQR